MTRKHQAVRRRATPGRIVFAAGVLGMSLAGITVAWTPRAPGPAAGRTEAAPQTLAPDAFARGALDTLLADLRQEIAAGSKIATPAAGVTVYAPKVPATAVPALVLGAATNTGGLNNLLKRSARSAPFYQGSNYDTSGFPAANRAAPLGSDAPSPDGRYVPGERWNKGLLLAKKSLAGDSAAPTADFVAPDWVLVARDGSNPTAWNPNLIDTGTNPTAVTGRYAYTIYDEGGLLDASVAGYPSNTPPAQTVYKTSLAAADLTQLTDAAGTPLLSRAQIDALINWRGAHPLFGRQDLVAFLTGQLADSPGTRAPLQNALQYLGTFSRGLEQPSFVKTQSVDASDALGYDATAPKLLAATAGGNNAGPDASGNPGLDAAINPSFLAVRVGTTVSAGRNDGTDLVAGEPLVKRRFPLNRLAWLTFAGPVASDGGELNPTGSAAVAQTIAALENTYGFTEAFLKQGTAANIYACFGLTWGADPTDATGATKCWLYSGHNRNGASGAISKLNYPPDASDVVRSNREADFFELLKASINVGALGKSSTTPAGAINYVYTAQYNNDSRVDDQIIQAGVNLIDQFDLDGYPTRVVFNDGGGARAFSGVENLPYLSRVVPALVKVKKVEVGTGKNIANTGVGALLQCPELWNPHDYNTANLDQTVGYGSAAPTKFRVYAQTQIGSAPVAYQMWGANTRANRYDVGSSQSQMLSPGWNSLYRFSWTSPVPHQMQLANTAMTFTVNKDAAGAAKFREPTILYQSSQVDSYPAANDTNYDTIASASNKAVFFAGDAFRSDVDSGLTGAPPHVGAGYVGFYVGATPLYWNWTTTNSAGDLPAWLAREYLGGNGDSLEFHYFVQYQDAAGNWVPYDEKAQSWQNYSGLQSIAGGGDPSASANGWAGFLHASQAFDAANMHLDPRAGRFGHIRTAIPSPAQSLWSYLPFNPTLSPNGWLSAASGIVNTFRNGTSAGVAVQNLTNAANYFPASTGWYPGGWGLGTTTTPLLRPGLLEQNNPDAHSDGKPLDNAPATVSGTDTNAVYYADPDGVVRRAMGGLAPASGSKVGLPMALANTVNGNNGLTRDPAQSVSRPMILNRPFRTVGELAYTFSGTPWKTLSFSLPESGDTGLLDVFSVGDPGDTAGLVAGKVNLNTRQAPVLQAVLAGAYKDEFYPGASMVDGGGSTSTAARAAAALVARTTDLQTTGKGPLRNVSELVGRWVASQPAASGGIDPRSYDGYSADLWNGTKGVLNGGADGSVERYQAAAIRALAACGQTRVWNLLVDVIAQTGQYPAAADSLAGFAVAGEQRYWLHVAIDRSTGQVLAQNLEAVPEPAVTLTNASVPENQPAGTPVGTLNVIGPDPAATYSFAFAEGEGSEGNGAFALAGNQLRTAATFQYLSQSRYNVRVRAIDQTGASFEAELAVTVSPAPFTRWKIAYFGAQAGDPAVAGDAADPDGDGLSNLLEYALGRSPTTADGPGVTVQRTAAGGLRMNYTRLSAATDVTAHPYWTNNLADPASWTTGGVTETLLSDDGTLQQWQAEVPASFGPRVFLRVQVTRP